MNTIAFNDADEVLITNIYGAGEDPIPGITSELIVDHLRKSSLSVHHIEGLENVEEYLANMLRPNDFVLTLGAGDIHKVAHKLSQRILV